MYKLYSGIIMIVLLFMACNTGDTSSGVIFSDSSYEQALSEAQKTDKKIFLDFYADW